MKNIEILAPVGSFKNLKLAISSGANAVYFGVKGFNARERADNVSIEELEKFVKLAHLHGVKTYLALNILIKNDEFQDALKVVDAAIDAKVDAFIVQDIGLATYLIGHYKNIVLHASTQMGIHNLAGAKFLEQLGFKRVVLSRETRIEDVRDIRENTNLEIEYFVQGALCVAFSGNCYFSSLCFGESGNRGRCLQPCRMLYESFIDNKKINQGYLMSPRDLCLINNLKSLYGAGVESFKIEGRLRRESYLIQAVKSYVNAINGQVEISEEINKLSKTFSRGDFNFDAYLDGGKNVINSNCANHRGQKIGRVVNFSKFKDIYKIEIKTNKQLKQNDGLKISEGCNEVSLGVGNIEKLRNGNVVIFSKHRPIIGDVYLSVDSEYESMIINDLKDKKIPLKISIEARANLQMKAIVKSGKIECVTYSDFICERAKNQPIKNDDIKVIFERIKDTEFELENINIDIDDIFVTKSNLNKFKNFCIDNMEKHILENVNNDKENVIKIGDDDKFNELYDSMGHCNADNIYNKTSLKNNKNYKIFKPKIYNLKFIEQIIDRCVKDNVYLNLPIFATKNEVKIIDEILEKLDSKIGIVINNYWHFKYIKNRKYLLGYNMNILNNYSAQFYMNLGAENYIRNIESYLAKGLTGGVGFDGYPVLMTWCHCPYKENFGSGCEKCTYKENLIYKLNDGKIFNVRRYKIINCYFELVSAKKIVNQNNFKAIEI